MKNLVSVCIVMVSVFSITAYKANAQETSPFTPIDTIVLDYEITMSKSIFVPEYNTQVNRYFTEINKQLCFIYAIDSVQPTTIFKLRGPLSSLYCVNKDSIIVNYPYSNQNIILNKNSEIIDSLLFDFGELYGEKKVPWTITLFFSNKNKNGDYNFYFQTSIPSLHNYQINPESRNKLYSEPILSCYRFSENNLIIENGIGTFPDQFRSKEGMYHYLYKVSLNRKQEFIFSFYELDSLYIYSNGIMKTTYLNSRYKTNEIHYPKDLNIFDIPIQEEASSKTVGYQNHYYDSYRDQYYVIVKKQYPYENEDGTYNKSADAPWSLMILNNKFEKVDEIDMPFHLSKHEFFIVPEGIAIKDKNLTDQNSGNSVLVLYKIKNYNL